MCELFKLYQKVCMLAGVDCVSLRLLAVIDEFEFYQLSKGCSALSEEQFYDCYNLVLENDGLSFEELVDLCISQYDFENNGC